MWDSDILMSASGDIHSPSSSSSSCSAAGQLSQSAHFSLQLPYTVLGLGRSANFLDHLFVGIPRRPGETVRNAEIWLQYSGFKKSQNVCNTTHMSNYYVYIYTVYDGKRV